jgi:hypothetical protein
MRLGRWEVEAGDIVTIKTPTGWRTGRVSPLLMFPSHVVLNCGGPHGTPAVADEWNIVEVRMPRWGK